jgi:hypothetical protein
MIAGHGDLSSAMSMRMILDIEWKKKGGDRDGKGEQTRKGYDLHDFVYGVSFLRRIIRDHRIMHRPHRKNTRLRRINLLSARAWGKWGEGITMAVNWSIASFMPRFEMVNVPPVYSSGFNLAVRRYWTGGLLSVSGFFAEEFDFVADGAETFALDGSDDGGD